MLLAGLASLALATAHAAAVKVSFVDADRYADAGSPGAERESNLAALAAHLSGIGQRLLPADVTLEVDVLALDLAGTVKPSRRGGDVRIVRGKADFPRMTLRYRLVKDGQLSRSDTDQLADLTYTMHARAVAYDESLRYEKRMLDEWFRTRFVDQVAAAR